MLRLLPLGVAEKSLLVFMDKLLVLDVFFESGFVSSNIYLRTSSFAIYKAALLYSWVNRGGCMVKLKFALLHLSILVFLLDCVMGVGVTLKELGLDLST